MERCPVCDGPHQVLFFAYDDLPAHCNRLSARRQEALDVQRASIQLTYCSACGLVYNRSLDAEWAEYTQDYEHSPHYSPRFRQYAQSLVRRLCKRYDLYHRRIVEIGCGNGEFLAMLCAEGDNQGLGFDPTFTPQAQATTGARVTILPERFGAQVGDLETDLVCCRHTLQQLGEPRRLLDDLRAALQQAPDAALYFEVPNALATLRDLAVWEIQYEHRSYFCAPSLTTLFTLSGFEVTSIECVFGNQYLTIEARPGRPQRLARPGAAVNEIVWLASSFAARYAIKVARLEHELAQRLSHGQRAVVWGAGARAAMLLNTVRATEAVDYVVDLDARNEGRFIAGSGQQVVAPTFLRRYHPELVLLPNLMYEQEARLILSELGVEADILVA